MDLLIHTPIQTFIEYQKNKMHKGEIPLPAHLNIWNLNLFRLWVGAKKFSDSSFPIIRNIDDGEENKKSTFLHGFWFWYEA